MTIDNLTPYWKLEPEVEQLRKLIELAYGDVSRFLDHPDGPGSLLPLLHARASLSTALANPLLKKEEKS